MSFVLLDAPFRIVLLNLMLTPFILFPGGYPADMLLDMLGGMPDDVDLTEVKPAEMLPVFE